MITLDMQVKIAEWREKIRNKTITREELKEAIAWLRQDRKAAASSSKSTPGAKKSTPVNSDALLGELDGL